MKENEGNIIPLVFKTIKAKDINFDKSILSPVKTGKIIDELFSYSIGIMPATVIMIPGGSGVGKTTLMLQLLGMIKEEDKNKDVLFISSEMNSIHIFKYKKRINFENLDVCLLSESEYPYEELIYQLNEGWDIVLVDSLADTINKLKAQKGYSENEAETEMLKVMDYVRRGNNKKGKFTTFLCTHHMTKGQSYTGTTNLKHMTDAMMELHKIEGKTKEDEDEKEIDERFIVFSKNRDGKTGKKLYYTIGNNGITFDEERYNKKKDVVVKTFYEESEEEDIENKIGRTSFLNKFFPNV